MLKLVSKGRWFFLMACALLVFPIVAGAAQKEMPSSMVSIGGQGSDVESEVQLKLGDTAPEFTLPNLATDKMESLKDYHGKPIVLVFIQSACYSCLQEAKALKTLKDENPGLEVLAVGVDLLGKPMLVSWAAHNNINFPVLLDPIFSVPEKYGFYFTPASVIIDKDGKIAFIHSGFRPQDIKLFQEKVKELLAKH